MAAEATGPRPAVAVAGQATAAKIEHLHLSLWTDDPALAERADAAGLDRVGIDLERLGKHERQAGLDTWISPHTLAVLPAIRASLRRARLFARTDPVHDGTAAQVDELISAGVQMLMLPYFRTPEEVAEFLGVVDGRAGVVLLLETADAARRIDEILALGGIEEVHVGVNDFAIGLDDPHAFVRRARPAARPRRRALTRGVRALEGGPGRGAGRGARALQGTHDARRVVSLRRVSTASASG